MECGIGLSQARDLVDAIREAARQAREALRGAPQGALVVSAGDPIPGAGGIAREVLGCIPVVGGGSAGLITDSGVVSHGVAVVCFRSEEWVVQSACAGSAAVAPVAAADRVARLILSGRPNRRRYPRGVALAFGDGRAAQGAGPFASRWREIMGPKLKSVVSLIPEAQTLYCGAVRDTGPVSVLCLEGPGPVGIGVGSGWTPLSLTCTATRTEGSLVHELDGQPAAEVYAEAQPGSPQDPTRFPLGIALPEDQWLIRSVLAIEGTSLRLGADLPAGTEVRVMAASTNGLQHATQDAAVTALKRLEGQAPSAVLVVEGAARRAVQNGSGRREWEMIREQVSAGTPLLGWLTASELVPSGSGQVTLQNGTVTVIAFP
ncbi:MAG: FIST C-terminal domain-containing protein, partial [candidate division NC10 bacterium]